MTCRSRCAFSFRARVASAAARGRVHAADRVGQEQVVAAPGAPHGTGQGVGAVAETAHVTPEVFTWCITGSYIDGAIQTFGRAGFEIVVIDPVGELAAYAFGLPRVWVSSTTSVEG